MAKRMVGVCALVRIFAIAQRAKAQTVTWDNGQPVGGTNKITGSGTYANAPAGAVKADIQVAVKDAAMKVTTYKYGSGIGKATNPDAKSNGSWNFDTSNVAKLAAGTYEVQAYIRFFDKNGKVLGKDITSPRATGIVVKAMCGCPCPSCPPPCCPPCCPPPCCPPCGDGE